MWQKTAVALVSLVLVDSKAIKLLAIYPRAFSKLIVVVGTFS